MEVLDTTLETAQLYECMRLDAPLELTGRLDDPRWRRAQCINLVDAVTGCHPQQQTEARLLYDNTHLYVGFSCQDDYVWGTLRDRDSKIFNEECVEVFLCPSGKLRQYYEINVSPLNTVYDALVLNGRKASGRDRKFIALAAYDCEGIITRTFVDGQLGVRGARGWSAEYAIPFSALIGHDNLTPEPGDEWRMNLYRIDAPQPDYQTLDAWQPTGARDFHLPWRFGRLVFG